MAIAKKKKKFWDVDMPLLKKKTQLYSFSEEELDGRRIIYDLTRILRGKNALLNLKVINTKEGLTSLPKELTLLPNFLKRMVRKGTDYVEDSFKVESKDALIEIKPILVTRRRVSRAVKNALRVKTKEEIEKYARSKTSERIFDDILKNAIQKTLSMTLKKIYPLSLCEIRSIKILKVIEYTKKDSEEKEEQKE